MATGWIQKELKEKIAYIKKLRESIKDFEFLFGGEVDISGAGLLGLWMNVS